MKKSIIAASAILALSAASSAYAGNTITFLGEITDSTCKVMIEGTSSGDGTVNLPKVSKDLLSAAGSTAGRTSFALVTQDCSLANGKSKVNAFFNGAGAIGADAGNVDGASGYLNNLAADPGTAEYPLAATNVQLRLINGTNEKVIKAGYQDQVADTSGYVDVDTSKVLPEMQARMPFMVEYISTAGGATAGPVKGMVVYDLMYN